MQMTIQITFCYFSSDSPEFLHVALKSFGKRYSKFLSVDGLSTALHFVL